MAKVFSILIRLALIGFLIVHAYATVLKFVRAPGSILMTQRAMSGETIRRDWTPIENISPHLVRAVIAAEDTGFCQHEGIDMSAISKALEEREQGRSLRGASTITQQTAKNVFLWNGCLLYTSPSPRDS